MRLKERVVRVVANAPMAKAVWECELYWFKEEYLQLTGLPKVLFTILEIENGHGFPAGERPSFAVSS